MTDWEAAEPNDKRREASVLTFPTNFDYAGNRTDNWMEATGYQQKKICAIRSGGGEYYSWCAQNANGGNGATTGHYQVSHFQSMPLIRFADVLLMHSELTETVDGINRVRSRAGLPPIGYSLKALQDERRWELAFEGLRWDDIRRWGIAKEALQKQLGGKIYNSGIQTTMKDQGGGYAARYDATRGFYKIPQTQVDLSAGTIKQNNGWNGTEGFYASWTE